MFICFNSVVFCYIKQNIQTYKAEKALTPYMYIFKVHNLQITFLTNTKIHFVKILRVKSNIFTYIRSLQKLRKVIDELLYACAQEKELTSLSTIVFVNKN